MLGPEQEEAGMVTLRPSRRVVYAVAPEGTPGARLLVRETGHHDVSTTMIYTHVLNRDSAGVRSPADRMLLSWRRPEEIRSAAAVWGVELQSHAG